MCSCCCTKILITGGPCSKIDPIILVRAPALPAAIAVWPSGPSGKLSVLCVPGLCASGDWGWHCRAWAPCSTPVIVQHCTSGSPLLHFQSTCTWNWLEQGKGKWHEILSYSLPKQWNFSIFFWFQLDWNITNSEIQVKYINWKSQGQLSFSSCCLILTEEASFPKRTLLRLAI